MQSISKFAARVGLGYAAAALTGAVVAIVALVSFHSVERGKDEIAAEYARDLIKVVRAREAFKDAAAASRAYLLTGEDRYLNQYEASRREFERRERQLRASDASRRRDALLDEAVGACSAYENEFAQAVEKDVASQPRKSVIAYFDRTLNPIRDRAVRGYDRLLFYEEQTFVDALEESHAAARRGRLTIIIATTVGLGICFLVAVFLTGQVTRLFRVQQAALKKAEEATLGRDELVAVVSHDLRNPLNGILLQTTTWEEMETGRRSLQLADESMARIARAARGIQNITEILLDAASLRAGKMLARPGVCEVDSLLQEIREAFEPLAREKPVRFQLRSDKNMPGLWADRNRALQVLWNLLSNALRHTPEGGQIILRVERQTRMVRFSIADTGTGIPQDKLPRLFDRYWQGGVPRRPRGEGLGLGLYIARGLVENMGGQIGVISEVDHGTTFWFTLPIFTGQTLSDEKS